MIISNAGFLSTTDQLEATLTSTTLNAHDQYSSPAAMEPGTPSPPSALMTTAHVCVQQSEINLIGGHVSWPRITEYTKYLQYYAWH